MLSKVPGFGLALSPPPLENPRKPNYCKHHTSKRQISTVCSNSFACSLQYFTAVNAQH